MIGSLTRSDGAAWVRYDAFGPPLAAYAANLISGPITVLWKGSIDLPHLHQFFADAALVVASDEKVLYRTWILTRTGRDFDESPAAPPLGQLAQSARFVRFECVPAAPVEGGEADPFLVAWANLDEEPEENAQESIGIYFRRKELSVILTRIESLVIDTAASRSFPRSPGLAPTRSERTKHALQALQQDLA